MAANANTPRKPHLHIFKQNVHCIQKCEANIGHELMFVADISLKSVA